MQSTARSPLPTGIDGDIAALNLESIAFKVCMDEGWNVEEVDNAEHDYRLFLQAVRRFPNEALAPTKAIDVFWHHHILDTSKYTEDCARLFGRYIHHYPYSGVLSPQDAQEQEARFRRTQALMTSIQENGDSDEQAV